MIVERGAFAPEECADRSELMSGTVPSTYSLAFAAAVNDEEVLRTNLAASPIFRNAAVPLIAERGYPCASQAYNHALDHSDADVVVFVHQDVYLPAGWEGKLLSAIHLLDAQERRWAVLGVVGMDVDGKFVGRAWSNGLQYEINQPVSGPTPVQSLDEIVLVLKRSSGVRFDADIPGFHLYGTDIAQSAWAAGLEACVFDGPVVHNSLPVLRLDASYRRAYRAIQRKWRSRLPLGTTVVAVTRWGWPLFRAAVRLRWLGLRRVPVRHRHDQPGAVARQRNYE